MKSFLPTTSGSRPMVHDRSHFDSTKHKRGWMRCASGNHMCLDDLLFPMEGEYDKYKPLTQGCRVLPGIHKKYC
jgi:hypothetical protein